MLCLLMLLGTAVACGRDETTTVTTTVVAADMLPGGVTTETNEEGDVLITREN